jgi:hypothetical protein
MRNDPYVPVSLDQIRIRDRITLWVSKPGLGVVLEWNSDH